MTKKSTSAALSSDSFRYVTAKVLSLAVPAFFTLVAEPIFLLVDSAMIGRLGTPQLGAIAISSIILNTIVGLLVFLAYSTTSQVGQLERSFSNKRSTTHGT